LSVRIYRTTDFFSRPYLHSITTEGQRGYGIQAVDKDHSMSQGARMIINIVVNCGSNTLAEALIHYQIHYSTEEFKNFASKIRVFENGSQDNSGKAKSGLLRVVVQFHGWD
jgi:hypothetical protein